MTDRKPAWTVCDDWISVPSPDSLIDAGLRDRLLAQDCWLEIVSGLDAIAVQFDPGRLTPEEALSRLRGHMQTASADAAALPEPITIPVCYDAPHARDAAYIAEKLGIPVADLAAWHSSLRFHVALLGFMPGFAYLRCEGAIPDIGRLATPRAHVAAGSIGIIGDQSSIYPFDSPGGWPIIGRTPLTLFNPDAHPPALLAPGQPLAFQPISSTEFDAQARVGQASR